MPKHSADSSRHTRRSTIQYFGATLAIAALTHYSANNHGVKEIGDEEINGKLWRVTGPHDVKNLKDLKFSCVSYVWGLGTEKRGSFFNCKREISDKTKPALTAAIKATGVGEAEQDESSVNAFWIDTICIPQLDSPERFKTLESMGFIYSAATSVMIVLEEGIWEIIESVSSEVSPRALSYEEMQVLEHDNWISRVWTYQELVNGRNTFFTTLKSTAQAHAIHAEDFFNCVSFSFDQWKKRTGKGHSAVFETFHNLDALEDALADRQLGHYLDRVALGVLSNMAHRKFDPKYPQNRLLASLGALTQDVSWGPPSATLEELAEKLMSVCESNHDYSFIYTSDARSNDTGMRWRPNPSPLQSNKPIHLVPVANWHTWGTQSGRLDSTGYWLDKMVQLKPARTMDEAVEKELEKFVYGSKDSQEPDVIRGGIFRRKECGEEELSQGMLRFLRKIGFEGDQEPQMCKTGLFFSQVMLTGRESVELYAASGIVWTFGSPGLARWKDGGRTMYSAGVFTGSIRTEVAEVLLLE